MSRNPELPEPVVAVVVAAGSGVRLGEGVPKALRTVAGRALVSHSVAALAAGGVEYAVVVTRPELTDEFTAALADAPIPWSLAPGGAERQDSVHNGLTEATARHAEARLVLVHDAARPFVPPTVVAEVIAALRSGHQAVIPVIPVVDTIRAVTPGAASSPDGTPGASEEAGGGPRAGASVVVDRSVLRAVQTPQGFDLATLRRAHAHVRDQTIAVTDDAGACEAIGTPVHLVTGSREALKITEPFDLAVAEAIWTQRHPSATPAGPHQCRTIEQQGEAH